jgi:prevent-host-death family protein
MRRINLSEDIQPLSEFRANAAAMLRRVRESRRSLVLTQRGHSAAVVLDVRQYESLLEELELLRDVHLAEQQLAAGEGVPHEEAREQIRERLTR